MTSILSDQHNPFRLGSLAVDSHGSLRPVDKYDGPPMMADRGPVQFHVMAKPGQAVQRV